jgi:uncharacterized protein (DUF924 family)
MSTLPPAAAAVIDFWFGRIPDDAATAVAQRKLWWSKDAAIDADMRTRFATLINAAASGIHDDWTETPRGQLALILLFDQFPRNIYRDTPQSFEYDERALQLAQELVATTADRSLRRIERVFCYLPLEHAESIEMQRLSVELFTALAADSPEPERKTFAGYVEYAVRHHEVIARFGRFPHRNRILGRVSTREENDFLKRPGSSF